MAVRAESAFEPFAFDPAGGNEAGKLFASDATSPDSDSFPLDELPSPNSAFSAIEASI